MTTSAARLFVLLARQAPIGVILRRGPSDWVQMIKWHTDTDAFEVGQWFHGGVNGWNSDLSPDGELILCLMTSYKQHKDPEFWDSWTAMSKPPYFTALVTWPQWGGGGVFIDNRSVHVGIGKDVLIQPKDALDHIQMSSEPSPYRDIWVRKGWQPIWIGEENPTYKKQVSNIDIQLVNNHSRRNWTLSISIHIDHIDQKISGIEWADFDQQGRLVLAKDGKLFAAALTNNELKLTELADFNANKPEQVVAPEWAQKW